MKLPGTLMSSCYPWLKMEHPCVQTHLPTPCCPARNKKWFVPLLFSDMDQDRFGGKMEGNREFISFQFSFFPLCPQFICLCLPNHWEIMMSESSDLKNCMPFPLKWQLRYLSLLLEGDSYQHLQVRWGQFAFWYFWWTISEDQLVQIVAFWCGGQRRTRFL